MVDIIQIHISTFCMKIIHLMLELCKGCKVFKVDLQLIKNV